MDPQKNYFKDIDFDKPWEEEDWERFFQAQEQLLSETRSAYPRYTSAKDATLDFRYVLRRFGMDPETVREPAAPPETADEAGDYWKDGAAPDTLPVFTQASRLLQRAQQLFERRLAKKLSKRFKSQKHKIWQETANIFRIHIGQVPLELAAGHALGYETFGVKGNIARNRRALARLDACLGALSRSPANIYPENEHSRLFRETLRLRNNVAEWIHFLRERFAKAGQDR